MMRSFTTLAVIAVLAGCDGENPFQVEATSPTGETEVIDPIDPNTDVNNRFAFDTSRNITMNSVVFDDNGTAADPTDDTLVINNLPFDGPDGVYDDVAGADTVNARGQRTNIFQNREDVINGEMQYYAVMVRSDYLEATSAAGRNWGDFGFAGANLNRSEYTAPTTPETSYEYIGVYAATRTYDDRGGIELIRGDVRLLLDVGDLDPNFPGEGLQGAIVGTVTGRTRDANGDSLVGDLPDISLTVVSFNTATGVWEDEEAFTYFDGDVRDTGTHSGLIAGPNAEEMGGYVVMEGAADIQEYTYEVVEWQALDGSTGTTSALEGLDPDFLQNQVNAGTPIGNLTVDPSDLPPGATETGSTVFTDDISTDYNAREIGVFVTDIN